MHPFMTIVGLVALTSLSLATACDQSKPALDKAVADLAAVTLERNALRDQLAARTSQVTALNTQVADLQAKLAAMPPATVQATAAGAGTKAEPVAPNGREPAVALPSRNYDSIPGSPSPTRTRELTPDDTAERVIERLRRETEEMRRR